MKKSKALILSFSIFVFSSSSPVFAADACEVVLCMFGKVTGNSQSECSSAERAFFSINAFKKKGRFDPSQTFNMRRNFLGGCPSADPAEVSKILGAFGRIRG
ncbi:hypothetical protein KCQ_05621 [Pectobacterium atrosepticum ICMP 1526]|uniref:TrbM/KikA/MpfK family conjugal transfer protein n=1 Tax=Pectobacterium atrosepticum TaxID=29471 RepID=UPI00065D15EA|nr:TrbM/KikA/MpfK family conjugal transfer protein [Pectobacterium atrosepticum]KMK87263.1 hypothetical protein KCQ_05621 [Pectobacterium atrosepticum ICMP 1526]